MATRATHQVESECIDFLLGRPTLAEIADFHPSEEASDRFYELVDAERERRLTEDEVDELDAYMYLEHLMRMMKAEAHRRLAL